MGRHILIADDEPGLRRSLLLVLSEAGYEVTLAEDGQAALDKILAAREEGELPDLLVTDIQMPNMSGLELIDELARREIALPSLVITGYGDKETVVELLRKGCKDFIDKPFGPEEALGRVEEVLAKEDRLGRALAEDRARLEQEKSRLSVEIEGYRKRFDELSSQINAATAAYHDLLGISGEDYRVKVAWRNRPLSRLGGDYVGICNTPSGVDLMVADVAGHDAGASFHTILIKAFFEENCKAGTAGGDFFRLLNNQLVESSKTDRMVTAIFAQLDLDTFSGEVVSAAHPYMYRLPAGHDELAPLGTDAGPLGIFEEAEFGTVPFRFEPGDRFFLHTDGVSDATFLDVETGVKVKLTVEGLCDLIEAYAEQPLEKQVESVWSDVMRFCGQKPRDDMLFLAFEIPKE